MANTHHGGEGSVDKKTTTDVINIGIWWPEKKFDWRKTLEMKEYQNFLQKDGTISTSLLNKN